MLSRCFLLKNHEIRVHSRTGAQSTKIRNLLFFDSRLPAAISPRVFRCFEKVIFLDFEVRKCENPRVFTLSPLKNTEINIFLDSLKITRFGSLLGRFFGYSAGTQGPFFDDRN